LTQLVNQLNQLLDVLNHCKTIGMRVIEAEQGKVTLELPYNASLVGNPETGVIHSGAATTLFDTAAGFSVMSSLPEVEICPTLDLRLDHMKPAEPFKPVYGFAETYKLANNVAFTRGILFQNDRNDPIAHGVATFMRLQAGSLTKLSDVMEKVDNSND